MLRVPTIGSLLPRPMAVKNRLGRIAPYTDEPRFLRAIMSSQVHPNVRAEVVGSLLRPDYLVKARQRMEAGETGPHELKQAEDRAVDDAIELQTRAGIGVITDGEQRRYAFFGHLVDAMAGFDKYGGW